MVQMNRWKGKFGNLCFGGAGFQDGSPRLLARDDKRRKARRERRPYRRKKKAAGEGRLERVAERRAQRSRPTSLACFALFPVFHGFDGADPFLFRSVDFLGFRFGI